MSAEMPVPAEPDGEPLTHFFHCWRFPDHHRCAVALIERQARENDDMAAEKYAAERKLRDVTAPVPGSVLYAARVLAEHYRECPPTKGPSRLSAGLILSWIRDVTLPGRAPELAACAHSLPYPEETA
jgi:hypothetical protein